MATIGLRGFRYAKLGPDGTNYGPIKNVAGAIEVGASLDLKEAALHADDTIFEYDSVFGGGTLTLGVADDDPETFSELLGNEYDQQSGIVTRKSDDTAIYVGWGYVLPQIILNVRKFRIEFFPKVKFKPYVSSAKTKGDSLEFTNPSVEGSIFENVDRVWGKYGVFTTETAANEALDNLFLEAA